MSDDKDCVFMRNEDDFVDFDSVNACKVCILTRADKNY